MPADSPKIELIGRIHAMPVQMVVAVTGGGSRAIAELLSVPGGSRTLLEAIVPYSAASLAEFLRAPPEHFCSARTVRAMAMTAFQRGRHLQAVAPNGAKPQANSSTTSATAIGVGCTASLASDRPKRGTHRIHVAFQTVDATVTHSLELVKGRRTRAQEEDVAAALILNAVAEAAGVEEQLPLSLIENEHVASTRSIAPPAWRELLLGHTEVVRHPACESGAKPPAVFSGAFNPLHQGHLRMAEIATKRLGVPVEFELSIENVDKPPLDYTEMEHRLAQFAQRNVPLWFSRAPTFEEKSRLFPGATFLVGADTLERIGQRKYYGDSAAAAEKAFADIAQHGGRFLMFGRLVDGKLQTLADLPLPESLRKLCDEVPVAEFREDISSTELRQQSAME